ncbi:hypothetical protein [Methanobrevibacter curvatus]|uniref:Uncharacterized protein n=1 Tax=Methanobrevibacter curvatus TaxID=49547 RepID=A0A166ALJ2_9EURY|nr:hypothetical protein [Methanobrevibacter curvatus]KZX12194.1 hypothetical protein MBCUR_11440 [Methanobrevibacter curvatus]
MYEENIAIKTKKENQNEKTIETVLANKEQKIQSQLALIKDIVNTINNLENESKYCPICDNTFKMFLPFGESPRPKHYVQYVDLWKDIG